MSISVLRRTGWITIALLAIAAAIYFFGRPISLGSWQPLCSSAVAPPVGDLPNMPDKPQPRAEIFDGCPPEGRGGDSELNLLKNRVDVAEYVPVSFDSLLTLTWPKSVEQLDMKDWSPSNRAFIAHYEGIPISVEGYIVNLREGNPETANCNWTSSSYLDWHMYFTKNFKDDRSQVILVEATPRVRLRHKWTVDLVHSLIIGEHMPVRLSGWLYFDPEHPQDLGQTRTTLWEIHPVMQIEVLQNGRWLPLDRFAK